MLRDGYTGKFGLETHMGGRQRVKYSHLAIRELIKIAENLPT